MSRRIKIFDTTLRDGEQSPGCSMNISEKLKMAEQLEKLGVDIIESGFAISSPGDFASVKGIASVVKKATVASLARCLKKDIDTAYEAVKHAVHPRIHVFLATSEVHMKYKLKMSREEVIAQIREMVAYAKSLCDDIEFSPEDGSRTDPDFLVEAVQAAVDSGATTINIPDTTGYAVPEEFAELIKKVRSEVKGIENVDISVHCHNDLGLATACTLAAIKAGATQVECTINGIGERAGNTALEEVVMNLKTRSEYYDAETGMDTSQIMKSSRMLSRITGVNVQPNKAIVGENAFAHEAGIHQHGVLANRSTYEIMTPESVGLTSNMMVLGKHSGKHALQDRLSALGYKVDGDELNELFNEFKVLADRQKCVSDNDLVALVHKSEVKVPEKYIVDSFVINAGNTISTTCQMKLRTDDGRILQTVVASKYGPVDASYKAINQLVNGESFELEEFMIDAVTGGTDAQGAVKVKIRANGRSYNGYGLGLDIVAAAINAYVSAINNMVYDEMLLENGETDV